ncbi:MAG TPA: hypothetical protein DCQ64_18585 [Candidatus Rokubacteria bacterium]|nr:hypothetical protein [Candidatus Rokubacteria bacterium]
MDPRERSGERVTANPAYDAETLVQRMTRMFREEWEKPFWRDLRVNVSLDFGYYTGTGQYDPAVRTKMQEAGKPALTFNRIKPTCLVLFGMERMNRYDPKAAPHGVEDKPVAEVFTRLIRKVHRDTNAEYVLSDGFEDGTICGVVGFELPIDYSREVTGEIGFNTVRVPEEWMWATPWKRYDLQDTRAMWRHKWVDVDELIALYPTKKDEILEALEAISSPKPEDASQRPVTLSQGDPSDAYGSGDLGTRPQDDRDFWFDEKAGRVRVLECYYPVYTPVWILSIDGGKRVIQSTSDVRMRRILTELARRDPTRSLTLIERNVRTIEMCVILPATEQELESGVPFETDRHDYPIVPFFAELKRDEVQGIVRSLRDAQDGVNARKSQIAWLTKATGDGWFADQDSLVDQSAFERDSRDPKGVYLVKKNAADPRRIQPPNVPQDLFQTLQFDEDSIRITSGVNASMRGLRESDESGVAMARAKQQGEIITMPIFDNFKLTKRLIYEKMARRIQEVYTDERVVRLLNPDTGEDEFVTVNQVVEEPDPAMSVGVRRRVLNDLGTLKYDLVLVETPASPTQRAATLATILDLLEKVPAATPILLDAIIELLDGLPEKVVQRAKKWVAERTEAPAGPPPPKVSISLRGELDPSTTKDLADGSLDAQPDAAQQMGAELGNPQNPSGQLPKGGGVAATRPDLAQ